MLLGLVIGFAAGVVITLVLIASHKALATVDTSVAACIREDLL